MRSGRSPRPRPAGRTRPPHRASGSRASRQGRRPSAGRRTSSYDPSCGATALRWPDATPRRGHVGRQHVTWLVLALACDFIGASERARFADTHLRVGVYPGPVLIELPRRVGMAWAREMSMTGNFIDAETALRIGLTNHVVPHDELRPFAIGLAQAIAQQDRAIARPMRH